MIVFQWNNYLPVSLLYNIGDQLWGTNQKLILSCINHAGGSIFIEVSADVGTLSDANIEDL